MDLHDKTEAPILEIRDLKKSYDGKNLVLKGLSISIRQGELVAVVGPSGAGKSTFIRCINRLVQPGSGEIIFDGEHVEKARGRRLKAIRTRIGMIFQHHNLIARTNVLKNVLHGRLGETPFYKSILGLYAEEDRREAERLLKTVGLSASLYQKAGTLSGGQMQRVGICRALMQRPKLLLADEPIASLDPASAKTVMDYIQKIQRERGLACIVNLHQVEFAKKYATRIVGIKEGRIVFDSSPQDLSDEMIAYIYEGEDQGPDADGDVDGGASGAAGNNPSTKNEADTRKTDFARKTSFAFLAVLLVIASFGFLNVNPLNVFASFPAFTAFFYDNFLPPNFGGWIGNVPVIISTLLFAVVGTYISAFLAFFLGILMAREMNPIGPLRGLVRFVVSFLRNVPALIWATIMVFIFGIGAMVGVLALVLVTLGFLARSYAESINEIAGTKLEAIRSGGAGYMQVLFHGLVPEFIPAWINWTLFSFEINIRVSALLGMVGAGGLGLLIQTNLDLRSFRRAAALVLILAVLVLVTEFLVNLIRAWMEKQRTVNHPPHVQKIRGFLAAACLVSPFLISVWLLDLDLALFLSRLENARRVFYLLAAFNPAALPEIVYQLAVSIALGICGLVIGCALSMVLAFLAASNITPSRSLSWAIKGMVSLIRAVPSLVLILMVVASLGFGYTSGVVGLVLSSVGYLTKAFIATIEEQDFGIIESLRATGASRLQIMLHGIFPCVRSAFLSWSSIRLESNIADSVSLGLVGAGGVGMLVSRAVRQVNFPNLTTTILVIFAAMLLIELATSRMKYRWRR